MFSEEFDRSLWLMLGSDKNNREDIVNFIRSVPNELYQQIYIQLDKYEKYEESNIDILDREDICLYGNCNGKYDLRYYFVVDMIQNSLTIGVGNNIDMNFIKSYEITLYAKSRYNSVDLFSSQILGNIINHTDDVKTEYELIDGLLGKMVVYSNNGSLKKYKKVSKNVDNLQLDNLLNDRGIIRVRKLG